MIRSSKIPEKGFFEIWYNPISPIRKNGTFDTTFQKWGMLSSVLWSEKLWNSKSWGMAGTRIITRRITETEKINRKDAGWMAPPQK